MKEKNLTQENKKSNLIVVSVFLILISVTLLFISLFYMHNQKKSDTSENTSSIERKNNYEQSDSEIEMYIYVSKQLDDKEVQKFRKKINELDGVISTTIYTKEEAFYEMKKRLNNNANILDETDVNIFPDAIIAKLDENVNTEMFQQKVKSMKVNGKVCAEEIVNKEYENRIKGD